MQDEIPFEQMFSIYMHENSQQLAQQAKVKSQKVPHLRSKRTYMQSTLQGDLSMQPSFTKVGITESDAK